MIRDRSDYKNLQKNVTDILSQKSLNPEIVSSSRGNTYRIKTLESTLEITIGSNWIGYDLYVDKNVLGKDIGSTLDTDNYALDSGNERYRKP